MYGSWLFPTAQEKAETQAKIAAAEARMRESRKRSAQHTKIFGGVAILAALLYLSKRR